MAVEPFWAKPSGHWELMGVDDGEVVLLGGLPEKPQAEDGDYWGRWVLDGKHLTLTEDSFPYGVPIDDCWELDGEARWLRHLSNKTWITAEDLGNLVLALNDLLGHGSW